MLIDLEEATRRIKAEIDEAEIFSAFEFSVPTAERCIMLMHKCIPYEDRGFKADLGVDADGRPYPRYLRDKAPTPSAAHAAPPPEREAELGDAVKHPKHYNAGSIEVWDAIVDWGLDFLLGNVVKYVARAGKKTENAVEDLRKAREYIDKALEVYGGGGNDDV